MVATDFSFLAAKYLGEIPIGLSNWVIPHGDTEMTEYRLGMLK